MPSKRREHKRRRIAQRVDRISPAARVRLLSGKFTSDDYTRYMRSDHWKRTRDKAFAFWGNLCMLCDHEATQIHHRPSGYKNLFREDVKKHLVPLCANCHRSHHRGKKRGG